ELKRPAVVAIATALALLAAALARVLRPASAAAILALLAVLYTALATALFNHAYALKDAAKAHADLESRATTGASILKP
ncbi:MAG: hypothetical protein E6447_20870, partial [Bradyrhizobium sp.]|nr:hypothetical protein [Bradyrhizobium sp.]